MAVVRKLQNKNNNHYLLIPASYCRALGWRYGTQVEVVLLDGLKLLLREYKIAPIMGGEEYELGGLKIIDADD